MKWILLLICSIFSLSLPAQTYAITDPLSSPNNKYGIHIIDESDLENASALVNSSGGDWGYVTIVIREDQRNVDQWNSTFSKMRTMHLIPIVRLATVLQKDGSWSIPTIESATSWVDFLSHLTWVTKNRYIVLFNEPNHAKEWGQVLSPESYAKTSYTYAQLLKQSSDDFFLLPAGLDASAPSSWETMDEKIYLRRMLFTIPQYFDMFDGWTSHSYPNPGFRGNVKDIGRGTLRTYKWELSLLKSWGIQKHLPIFITETGWAHAEGTQPPSAYVKADDVADRIGQAAESIWTDDQIVAITPFVLHYPAYPFSNFSWQIPQTTKFYPQFDTYRSIVKIAGSPYLVITPTPIQPTPTTKILGIESTEVTVHSQNPPSFLTTIASYLIERFKFL